MKETMNLLETFSRMFSAFTVVDLSHTLENDMPAYPTHPKYFLTQWNQIGDPSALNMIVMGDHSGTHLDSTSHFIKDQQHPARRNIDEISPTAVFGRAIKATFGPFAATNQVVTKAELVKWEEDHIEIKEGDIFIIDFQWGAKWFSRDENDHFLLGWPGLAKDAVDYLLSKKIKAIGTDCVSIDPGDGGNEEFPAHFGFLPNGVLIIENLTNLEQIPVESYFMAIPLKIKDGTASPIRPIALIPPE